MVLTFLDVQDATTRDEGMLTDVKTRRRVQQSNGAFISLGCKKYGDTGKDIRGIDIEEG
jgi:hypothetical protein